MVSARRQASLGQGPASRGSTNSRAARALLFVMVSLLAAGQPRAARAADVEPRIHPIYIATSGAAGDKETRQWFSQTVRRYEMGPVETMDLPSPSFESTADELAAGMVQVKDVDFQEGENALRVVALTITETGGAGLNTQQLSDAFLFLGMAIDRADWRELPPEGAPSAQPDAAQAYLQAALLTPNRKLYHRDFPPIVQERWKSATNAVAARPTSTVTITGPRDALARFDGGPLMPLPATLQSVSSGPHFLRVEAPGRAAHAAVVEIDEPATALAIPGLRSLSVDPETVAAKAQRMGGRYALTAQLEPARSMLRLQLIDAETAHTVHQTALPARGDRAALDAALLRLKDVAKEAQSPVPDPVTQIPNTTLPLPAPAPEPPTERFPSPSDPARDPNDNFSAHPGSWARRRWPLLAAIGGTLASAVVLTLAVSLDGSD